MPGSRRLCLPATHKARSGQLGCRQGVSRTNTGDTLAHLGGTATRVMAKNGMCSKWFWQGVVRTRRTCELASQLHSTAQPADGYCMASGVSVSSHSGLSRFRGLAGTEGFALCRGAVQELYSRWARSGQGVGACRQPAAALAGPPNLASRLFIASTEGGRQAKTSPPQRHVEAAPPGLVCSPVL